MGSIAIFPLSLMAGALLWLAALPLLPLPHDVAWIDEMYSIKEAAAERISGPRIILVGGSATHFGFSATELTKATGVPAVNLGSYAGLGVHYILTRAKRTLRSGDIAIVSLEPTLLYRSWPVNGLAGTVLRTDPRYLLDAPMQDTARLLVSISPLMEITYQVQRLAPFRSPLYQSATIDRATGDETANTANNALDMRARVAATQPIWPVLLEPGDRLWPLQEFGAWAKARNVRIFFAWTPLLCRDVYQSDVYRRYFANRSDAFLAAGFAQLGDPEDYMVPLDMTLDTAFHLTTDGARAVTAKMARHLMRSGVGTMVRRQSLTNDGSSWSLPSYRQSSQGPPGRQKC
jgi:hypothetical protein